MYRSCFRLNVIYRFERTRQIVGDNILYKTCFLLFTIFIRSHLTYLKSLLQIKGEVG